MPTILPDPTHLRLDHLCADSEGVTVVVSSKATYALCPLCRQRSYRIHNRYIRTLADLPWNGVAVRLQLTVQRFFCATNVNAGEEVVLPHFR